jgi:hypothetical protein
MLEHFATWLAATPLSTFVADQAWVVPTVQTVHILAIAVVMASVLILNLRVLGLVSSGQSIAALSKRFIAPAGVSILVLAATGFLMIAGEPTRAIFRYVFWAKMALLLAAIAITTVLLTGLRANGVAADISRPIPTAYRGLAIAGLLVWVAIIITGRWIGYAEGWPGSPS